MFKSAIIKLTAFCNLNCSYCYMFNSNDTTYKEVPKAMHVDTAKKIVDEVYDYMSHNNMRLFTLILHGGEPFLWDLQHFIFLLDYVANKNNSTGRLINIVIQTNGYKINKGLVSLLKQHQVPLGISIDGPREIHDRFRVTHNNRPTYNTILQNLQQLIEDGYDRDLIGLLSVVNPVIPAAEYFNWVKTLPVNRVNVLWPIEFNYNNTPWDHYQLTRQQYAKEPLYGKWFADLFTLWFREDNPDIFIKSFYELLALKLGGKRHSDSLVNDELAMFVVDTNGHIEYHDYFRAFKDKSIKTGYSIFTHSITDMEKDPVFDKCSRLKEQLPPVCKGCDQVNICGGGFLSGRMQNDIQDFSINRSILCHDQKYFFDAVESVIAPAMADLEY